MSINGSPPYLQAVHVYFDQFVWIQLLRAREGEPDGAGHRDILLLVEEAVRRGQIVLPLSRVHYVETARRRPYKKREPLARLMTELSGFNTMAPFGALVRAELRKAVADWFGSRIVPEPPQPFGFGADHAFADTAISEAMAYFIGKYGERAAPALPVLEWGALARHPDHDVELPGPSRSVRGSRREGSGAPGESARRQAGGWMDEGRQVPTDVVGTGLRRDA